MGFPSLRVGFMGRKILNNNNYNIINRLASSSFSKVPQVPTKINVDSEQFPRGTPVDYNLVEKLERLALVNFDSEVAVERLKETIRSAEQIFAVDTTDIKPMVSLLEDRALYLRDDKLSMTNSREEILQNASATLEDYFVAPPGNIPLQKKTD